MKTDDFFSENEDTEHPFVCRIMNLLWKLSDKGTVTPLNQVFSQLAAQSHVGERSRRANHSMGGWHALLYAQALGGAEECARAAQGRSGVHALEMHHAMVVDAS